MPGYIVIVGSQPFFAAGGQVGLALPDERRMVLLRPGVTQTILTRPDGTAPIILTSFLGSQPAFSVMLMAQFNFTIYVGVRPNGTFFDVVFNKVPPPTPQPVICDPYRRAAHQLLAIIHQLLEADDCA